MARIRIGTSGWSYDEWRGPFYPEGLPASERLRFASRRLDTIEVNASFYSRLRPETYRKWGEQVPSGFVLAVKGPRFVTHVRRLAEVQGPLANFFASGVLLLGRKLGPILWQLPASMPFDPSRLEAFLQALPRDQRAAVRLGAEAAPPPAADALPHGPGPRRLRHALEVRNPDALRPELVRMLRRHRVALVVSDAGRWPLVEEVTAAWVYVRLHGRPRTYASAYSRASLRRWAARVVCWARGGSPPDAKRISQEPPPAHAARDVYVYFDNDRGAHAPADALALARLVREAEAAGQGGRAPPRGARAWPHR